MNTDDFMMPEEGLDVRAVPCEDGALLRVRLPAA